MCFLLIILLKQVIFMAKKTISASIDERAIAQLDRAAKTQRISRSQLLQACIDSWFAQKMAARLKEGYLTQAETLKDVAEGAWETQREILDKETW